MAILWMVSVALPAAAQESTTERSLALERAARGDAEGAYEPLSSWVGDHPEDVEARGALAAVATQTGRLDEAEELLKELPGEDPRLVLLAADLALLRGEPRVAINRALRLEPGETPALDRERRRILGQAYVETGQSEKALATLGAVGSDPVLAVWRSRALFQAGRFGDAVDVLAGFADQIMRLGVDNAPTSQRSLMADILSDYARGLIALGRAEEALGVLEPNVASLGSRRGWNLLAQALVAAGRGEEARAALNRGAALTAAGL